ncbi:hypothetical protein FGO68_gene6496 [Halteria grandinella]|uniref:RBR-type E3 ubiquitin transferase n=1 Tax=Halteria grandinella TaxID=5974 RepID=A0A8J8NVL8_HALGN|nr:hypothetical protein FGO68_gene6496 [Halteria grandinella]
MLIKDDLIPLFVESDILTLGGKFKVAANGLIELKFQSGVDFEKVYQDVMGAQRRSFNLEEHECKICNRQQMGDKFFFLSGCQHYFCFECLKNMITLAIQENKVANLACANLECRKNLNDLDIKGMGLGKELSGVLQPEEVTTDMKERNLGANADYINIKFCAQCPGCKSINEKKTKINAINCHNCSQLFCYICNKSILGINHFQHSKTICNYESEHWTDL